MGSKTSCDYCDKVLDNPEDIIAVSIKRKDALILSIDLCSDECLEKTLDLGSKIILAFGCLPGKSIKQVLEYLISYHD